MSQSSRRRLVAAGLVALAAVPLLWLYFGVGGEVTVVAADEEVQRLHRDMTALRSRLDRADQRAAKAEAARAAAEAARTAADRPPGGVHSASQEEVAGNADWTTGLSAVLYSRAGCRGSSRAFNMSHREGLCSKGCFDTCGKEWDGGGVMHGDSGSLVRSAQVIGGAGFLRTAQQCAGSFYYPDTVAALGQSRKITAADGCVVADGSHFLLTVDEAKLPGRGIEAFRRAVRAVDPPPPPPNRQLDVVDNSGPDSPASRYQARDFLPVIKRRDMHKNFTERFRTPEFESGERTASCDHDEADRLNAEGVALVRAYLNSATVPRAVSSLAEAEPLFRRATELSSDCVTPVLNLAIVVAARLEPDEMAEGRQYALEACKLDPSSAKASLWAGVYAELIAWHDKESGRSPTTFEEADKRYRWAFKLDPTLPLRYFGRPHESWGSRTVPPQPRLFEDPNDVTERNYACHELQRSGMRRLLLYKEFGEFFGGHGTVTKAQAATFLDVWSLHLPRLIPPYPLSVLKDVYGKMVRGRYLRWQGADTKYWPEMRFTHHNGPMARFIQAAVLPRISQVVDRPLHPTYAYMGSYLGGGGIIPHLDREQCEWTLTITLDTPDSPAGASTVCPFGFAAEPNVVGKDGNTDEPFPKNELPPPEKRRIINGYPGDGAVVRGRAVVHWRPASPGNCTQFFFHFVTSDFSGDLN